MSQYSYPSTYWSCGSLSDNDCRRSKAFVTTQHWNCSQLGASFRFDELWFYGWANFAFLNIFFFWNQFSIFNFFRRVEIKKCTDNDICQYLRRWLRRAFHGDLPFSSLRIIPHVHLVFNLPEDFILSKILIYSQSQRGSVLDFKIF